MLIETIVVGVLIVIMSFIYGMHFGQNDKLSWRENKELFLLTPYPIARLLQLTDSISDYIVGFTLFLVYITLLYQIVNIVYNKLRPIKTK